MIPKNINDINTNVDRDILNEILTEIKKGNIKFENSSIFAEQSGAEFTFKRQRYKIVEEYEIVSDIIKQQ